ncbi:MAG: trypsin-like peptidase domain-containing protein [Flavihumibacter sp.]
MKTKTWLAVLAFCSLSAAGGYAYSKRDTTVNSILQTEKMPVVKTGYAPASSAAPVDFEKAATASVPSVVHIKTVTTFKKTGRGQQLSPDDLFGGDDIFRRFFGGDGRSFSQPDQKASGSGVIISSDGYIVTNNHVVDGANDISVTLNDRKSYKAKLVGTDANTDLALIRIDASNLPVIPVGNSDDVRLGQWVLAIGYPLNLDVTVTQGIVSAKSRTSVSTARAAHR